MSSRDGVLALDLGGGHVSGAMVEVDHDSPAVAPHTRRRATFERASGMDELLARILDVARGAARAGADAIGVAAPGPFDYETGVSRLRHKLEPLYGLDLRKELALALGVAPAGVRFLNDADAFLLGESWAGAARGHERVIGITLGSGIGSAFLDRHRLVRDGRGVPPKGALYRVPFRGGHVEERISARSLVARYGEQGVDVAEIARRARRGDARAGLAFTQLGDDLVEFLRPWLSAFAPSCVVVGGGIARSWELLEPAVEPLRAEVEVLVPARDIDLAPLFGAARHVLSEGAA